MMNFGNLSSEEECKKRPLSVISTSSSYGSESLRRQCKKHARASECIQIDNELSSQHNEFMKSVCDLDNLDWQQSRKCQLSYSLSDPTLSNLGTSVHLISLASKSCAIISECSTSMKTKNILYKTNLDMSRVSTALNDSNLDHMQRTISELLYTEELFVNEVDDIIKGYLIPLLSYDKDVPQKVFGNLVEISKFNSMFLDDLKKCCAVNDVCRLFIEKSMGFFETYSRYCKNFPNALQLLKNCSNDPSVAKYFKFLQEQLNHKLPLASYLLKPVQRISKYHLFFQNIVKRCERRDEVIVNKALNVMTQILKKLNQTQCFYKDNTFRYAVHEGIKRMSPTEMGDLVMKDKVLFRGGYKSKSYLHIFLFTKTILISQKKSKNKFLVKIIFKTNEANVFQDVVPCHPLIFFIVPSINPRFIYKFQAVNSEQKAQWCYNLRRVLVPPVDNTILIPKLISHLIEIDKELKNQNEVGKSYFLRHHNTDGNYMTFEQICLKNTFRNANFLALEKNNSLPLSDVLDVQDDNANHRKFSFMDDNGKATSGFKHPAMKVMGKDDMACLEKQKSFGFLSPSTHFKLFNNNKKRQFKKTMTCNDPILFAEAESVSPHNSNYLFTLKMAKSRASLKNKLRLSYKEAKCCDVVLEGCSGVYRKLPEEKVDVSLAKEVLPDYEEGLLHFAGSNSYKMLDFFYEDKLLEELEGSLFDGEDLNFNEDDCFCIGNDILLPNN